MYLYIVRLHGNAIFWSLTKSQGQASDLVSLLPSRSSKRSRFADLWCKSLLRNMCCPFLALNPRRRDAGEGMDNTYALPGKCHCTKSSVPNRHRDANSHREWLRQLLDYNAKYNFF